MEQMKKEVGMLREQMEELHKEFQKETTTVMEKVEISKTMVELYKVTKYSVCG